MSGRVIFMLEEPSMKVFLAELLPRLVPAWKEDEHFLLVKHSGKSDLDRSIPIKLKAWREPGVRFVIVRDNDGADCLAAKTRLAGLCAGTGREAVIRLICQELEGWYLGDEQALLHAYPGNEKAIRKLTKRFADPDCCLKPSVELEREIPEFQKQDAARRLGSRLIPARGLSTSCRVFAETVVNLASST